MATYLIDKEIEIIRQEGDTADIVIEAPPFFDISGATVRFKVKDADGIAFTKDSEDCTIEDQVLSIPIEPADTRGKAGRYRWELQFQKPATFGTVTAGRGTFVIIAEQIKETE